MSKVVAQRGAFLSKVHPPIYATIHAVMFQEAPKKQHCARGGTNKWRQTPWQKSHCRIRNITTLKKKWRPPPSLRSHLSSSPMGIFSRDSSSCAISVYTVKDLFGNQVFLEKSQTVWCLFWQCTTSTMYYECWICVYEFGLCTQLKTSLVIKWK